jgi:hypothetical protein
VKNTITIGNLGLNGFDQCVLNMGLINLCNRDNSIGQEMRRLHNSWEDSEPTADPWRSLHQITIYIPHPDQQYEGTTLEGLLTQGYNIELKSVANPSKIPYKIPEGGQFVVVMKQKVVNAGFTIAATGIFVRPLALMRLEIITDMTTAESESIAVKHPVIRDYPSGWEDKLNLFLDRTIPYEALPNLVKYVDRAFNPDYRPPNWDEVHLAAIGLAGV